MLPLQIGRLKRDAGGGKDVGHIGGLQRQHQLAVHDISQCQQWGAPNPDERHSLDIHHHGLQRAILKTTRLGFSQRLSVLTWAKESYFRRR